MNANTRHNEMNRTTLFGLLTALAVCGCGKKEATGPLAPVSVETITVGSSPSADGQTYSGTIEEESGTALSFAAMGTVQSVNVSEGQFVSKGQLIGVLDATSVRNAYEAAVATREQAVDARDRMKMLHDNGSLPDIKWVEAQTQVRQAEAQERIARKSLGDTRLYAPFSGYITRKNVEPGANVGPGVPVAQLVRIDRVKVKISVPEEEVGGMSVGQPLTVSVAALGGRTFTARISEKNVSADPLSRSYEVKAIMPNPSHQLLPGMIAEVAVSPHPAGGSSPTLEGGSMLLPADAVELNADNRTFVWTVRDGKAHKTFISTGGNAGDKVSVSAGLQPGDKVIVKGQQKVSEGMTVKD